MTFFWQVLDQMVRPFLVFFDPREEVFVAYWVSALAFLTYTYRRDADKLGGEGFVSYVTFSKALRSKSGSLDLTFFALNTIVYGLLASWLINFLQFLPGLTASSLRSASVALAGVLPAQPAGDLVLTIGMFVAADFAFFLAHVAFHRIPILWEFHKVHHSATALHPITAYRGHPLNTIATLFVTILLTGGAMGFVKFLSPGATEIRYAGTSAVFILVLGSGALLRHSSVWFHFGSKLNSVFYSPAHHQIHHSSDERHWNKNFGGMLAIWDRIFGTLYCPREREELSYGLGSEQENAEYTTIRALYFLPFVKAWRVMRWHGRVSMRRETGRSSQ